MTTPNETGRTPMDTPLYEQTVGAHGDPAEAMRYRTPRYEELRGRADDNSGKDVDKQS